MTRCQQWAGAQIHARRWRSEHPVGNYKRDVDPVAAKADDVEHMLTIHVYKLSGCQIARNPSTRTCRNAELLQAAPDGLLFSSDKSVSTVNVPGFWEVEDIGFGRPKGGNTYPRLMVRGWRKAGGDLKLATRECNDFSPSSPRSATWALQLLHPDGR